jgi:hypothetical protein
MLSRKERSTFSWTVSHLETVSADGIFGELSIIDLEARIASAKARTDCTHSTHAYFRSSARKLRAIGSTQQGMNYAST